MDCKPLLCNFSSSFLLVQFFMFILLIFLSELAAAILAFVFREHVSPPAAAWGRCHITGETVSNGCPLRIGSLSSCLVDVLNTVHVKWRLHTWPRPHPVTSCPDSCWCLWTVDQRVLQQGAETTLPGPQQHRCLHIHLERYHDHSEPLPLPLLRPLPSSSMLTHCPPAVSLLSVQLLWRQRAWGLRGEPLQAPQPQDAIARGLLSAAGRQRGAVCERQRRLQAHQGDWHTKHTHSQAQRISHVGLICGLFIYLCYFEDDTIFCLNWGLIVARVSVFLTLSSWF